MRRLVLWGHHTAEYRDMFNLSATDLKGRILEYGCGASAVNAESHATAAKFVSCDPLFGLDLTMLTKEIEYVCAERIKQFKKELQLFDFSRYGSLEHLIESRHAGINQFLADYEQGKKEERYLMIQDSQPLPFDHAAFDLALCANCLFSEIASQSIEYHLEIIQELARVAKEVRIFPLVDATGTPSPMLGPVLLGLQQQNYGVEVQNVSYHLQPKGHAMLRVWAKQCLI